MKMIFVTILCFLLLSFFSAGLFFLIKFFGRNEEKPGKNFQNRAPKKEETFFDILLTFNGTIFPGKLSNEMYNFSEGLELCSSMNMMMLDKPARLVKPKKTGFVDDGINQEMFAWINASMDENYSISGVPEMSRILEDFQKALTIQPVLILTRSNCYYSMKPRLTGDDWIHPELHWKRYVYFCEDFNNTDEPIFKYR